MRTTDDMRLRALRIAKVLGPVVALVVIAWVALTRFDSGGALLSVIELATAIVVIAAAAAGARGQGGGRVRRHSATTAGVVVSLFSELYPRVMVSSLGAANDLTVAGTASSSYALGVMTVVLVVLLPIILLYQGWTLHVFRHRVTRSDLSEDGGGHGPPPTAPAVVGAERDNGRRNGQDLPRAEPMNSYRGRVRFAAWVLSWAAALVIALLRGRGGRSGASRTSRDPGRPPDGGGPGRTPSAPGFARRG